MVVVFGLAPPKPLTGVVDVDEAEVVVVTTSAEVEVVAAVEATAVVEGSLRKAKDLLLFR